MNTAAMGMAFAGATVLLVLVGTPARAQNADQCISGFVWREAFPGDRVCVDPAIRARTLEDNRAAATRRQPGGGPFGLETCRQGFVWRDAGPNDHVCVTPQTRAEAAADNREAANRVAAAGPSLQVRPRPDITRGGAILAAPAPDPSLQVRRASPDITRGGAIHATPPPVPSMQPPPPRPTSGTPVKRGFDDNGNPYIEQTLPDGSVRREQRNGVTVRKPDGTSQFFANMFTASNAPVPTPPALPADPALGRGWVTFHNEQLLDLIAVLVNRDQMELEKFNAAEVTAAGSDLFRQVEYRTRILMFLAQP